MSLRDKHKDRDEKFQKLAVKLAKKALERPSDFGLRDQRLFYTHANAPVGAHHRDSDVLDKSNHEVILADLREKFPGTDTEEIVEVGRYGHWAVGWLETIVVPLYKDGVWCIECGEHFPFGDDEHYDANIERHARLMGGEHLTSKPEDFDEPKFEFLSEPWLACVEWYQALQDYPVADEEDYSNKERERDEESWESWGAGHFEDCIAEKIGVGKGNIDDQATFSDDDHDWRTDLRHELDRAHGGNEIYGSWYSGEPSLNEREFNEACDKHLHNILLSPKWWWLGRQVDPEQCIPSLECVGTMRDRLDAKMRLAAAAAHPDQQHFG